MLKDNSQILFDYFDIKKEIKNFCFSSKINKDEYSIKIKNLLEKILKAKYFKSYRNISYNTNIEFNDNGEIKNVKFNIYYTHEINLLTLKVDYNNIIIQKIEDEIFLFNNNIKVKTNNKYILELTKILKEISTKIKFSIINFLMMNDNKDKHLFANMMKTKLDLKKQIIKKMFIDKINFKELNKFIEDIYDIDCNDFELNCLLSSTLNKEEDKIINYIVFLSPNNLLKHKSFIISSVYYNINKDVFFSGNWDNDINFIKNRIDLKHNENKLNRYFINILNS